MSSQPAPPRNSVPTPGKTLSPNRGDRGRAGMSWPFEKLGAVVHLNPRLVATDRPDPDETVSFVPMAAVSAETLRIEVEAERPFSEVAKGYTPFKRGDVLIAKITPCFENGKMALADNLSHVLGFGTTEFHVLRPSEKVSGSYLFHLLRAPYVRKAGVTKMKGAAGQRRVPADFFASLQIPLPPLAEQKRIAGILDAADALRARRRESLAQLDTLLQSTFLEMFGDPVTNPFVALEDVCELITDGTHQTPTYVSEGVKFLSSKNVKTGEINWEDIKFIPKSLHRKLHKRLSPRRNDILLAKNGTTGTAAIVDRDVVFDIYVSLALLRPKDSVTPLYLLNAINSDHAGFQFKRALKGVGVPNLHLKEIRKTRIPLPPLELQQRFAAIVESVEQQKVAQRAHLVELDTLFAALQQRAFAGELVA